MADHQNEIYTIFCIAIDEDTAFPIEIESSESVGALKDAIKEEKGNRLSSVDADELKLYQVNIADDDDLVVNVKSTTLGSPLKATMKLVKIFVDTPKDDTVHIIVQLPKSGK